MKTAYLTIDDSPSSDFIQKVNLLYERRIPALIFCVGRDIQAREADVLYAIEKGFLIGNHSFSHLHFSDLSLEECIEEIQRTDRIITELYQRSGRLWPMKCFRFPYFDTGGDENSQAYEGRGQRPREERNQYPNQAKRRAIQELLRGLGYRQPEFQGINLSYFDPELLNEADVRCTFDQSEYWLGKAEAPWGLSTEEAILARIEEDAPCEGRSLNRWDTSEIILVHDHGHTTELFFKIIQRYLEKGIQFMPII